MTPVERSLPGDRRFTVLHHGSPEMLDHILASRALFGILPVLRSIMRCLRTSSSLITASIVRLKSLHAPIIAIFDLETS